MAVIQFKYKSACLDALEKFLLCLFFFIFTDQISDMQGITTDDEEYDQNSNHCKHCRKHRHAFVEGQISDSQSLPS